MKFNTLFALLISVSFLVQAQKSELGKVTKEELIRKSHFADTSAVASILHKQHKTTFSYDPKNGFSMITEVELKVKIYKTDGLSYGNLEIPYYIGYTKLNPDQVDVKECITYNLVNDKIQKAKLSEQNVFTQQVNEFWKTKTITMPEVVVGSIVEFKYIHKTENIDHFNDFTFQEVIPVDHARCIRYVPDSFVYKELLVGYLQPTIDRKAELQSQRVKREVGLSNTTDVLEFRAIKSVYEMFQVPALKMEPYVDNIRNYQSKLVMELEASYNADKVKKNYSKTWSDVAETIFNLPSFGGELQKRGYFEHELKSLASSSIPIGDRIAKGFEYVKSKIKWNGMYGYASRGGLQNAFKQNAGSVADVNLFLVVVLNYLGVPADPILLSTRSNGIAPFPTTDGFNYVIAGVFFDGKLRLLDATDANATLDVVPIRVLNDTGRLIRRDGSSEEVNLHPRSKSHENRTIMGQIAANGAMTGKARNQYSNYFAWQYRDKFNNISPNDYEEYLENKLGCNIQDLKVENAKDLLENIQETFEFSSNQVADVIGDKLYVRPILFLPHTVYSLKAESRAFPLDFVFVQSIKYMVQLQIPDGYTVEFLPESINLLAENLFSYQIKFSEANGKVMVQLSQEVMSRYLSSQNYKVFKDMFQKIIDKESEKIVLRKI